MKKRILTALLTGCLLLPGCGGDKRIMQKTTPDTYPLDTNVELTYWTAETVDTTITSISYDDLPIKRYLEEETGIKIKFIQPYHSMYAYMNIMVASNNLPDIIEMDWQEYTGGVLQRLIDNDILLPLNDVFEQVSPNLMACLEENPQWKASIRTIEGMYYMYPFIREKDTMNNYIGTMVRSDILAQRGLTVPETLPEWEVALRAYQEAGLSVPMTFGFSQRYKPNRTTNPFLPAFNILSGFYVADGKVHYGEYEPAFADYLRLMASWYEQGLIDQNFQDQNYERLNTLAANADIGAVTGNAGRDFGRWIAAAKKTNEAARFEPVPYAAAEKNGRPFGGGGRRVQIYGYGAGISTQCENPEIAARLLDYGYSPQGHMLYNFGREGESYEMISDEPKYQDFILNYQNYGYDSMAQAVKLYTRGSSMGPFIQDSRYLEQYYQMEEQKCAIEVWNDTDAAAHDLPILAFPTEEGEELDRIVNRVDNYVEEALYEMITGGATDSQISAYYATMRELDIKRAIEIQQAAYDRYLAELEAVSP